MSFHRSSFSVLCGSRQCFIPGWLCCRQTSRGEQHLYANQPGLRRNLDLP